MTSRRQRRISELLEEEFTLIVLELADPALESVSVTDLEVTPDLRHAHVYVGHHDATLDRKAALEALERATGHIRSQIAERSVMRFVPQISFHWDSSSAYGHRIDELLKEIGL